MNSLFHCFNSLFRFLGNFPATLWYLERFRRQISPKRAKFKKFPVIFPVGGEFSHADRFGGTASTTSQSPRTGVTAAGI
jgi:hypothetical protein